MNLEITANKIVSKYISDGIDMNDSIAKYAMENNLNIEETKRLVEESNKNCFLQKFASTGEQLFDVAQYNIVKEKVRLTDKVEKTAAIKFIKSDSLEKVASEEIGTIEYDSAITKVRSEIGSTLTKMAQLRKDLVYKNASLEKLAYSEIDELKPLTEFIERKERIVEILMEKRAGIITGITNGILKGSAKVGGKVIGTVAANPGKSLMAVGTIGTFKQGMSKVKPLEDAGILLNKTAEEVEKKADFKDLAYKSIKEALPGLAVFGGLGLGIAAARSGGGIVSRMMKERELSESFNTISQANSDIRQIPNARAYFDVIARHSPDLANDPMVAPQLIRQFDTFGGVDVNTVGKLREIQDRGSKNNKASSLEIAGNLASGLKAFSQEQPRPAPRFEIKAHISPNS